MLLGMILIFYFWILRIFGGNRKKCKSWKKKYGHYQASTPQCREPMLRHRPTPRRGIPSPHRGRGAKMAPLEYAAT